MSFSFVFAIRSTIDDYLSTRRTRRIDEKTDYEYNTMCNIFLSTECFLLWRK